MGEVHDFYNSFEKSSSSLRDAVVGMRGSIQNLSSMKSFSGKGATATKNYLEEVHMNVSLSYQDSIDDLQKALKSSIESFHLNVDESQSCIIKTDYIQSLEKKLKSKKEAIKKEVDAINAEIASVSSICHVSKVNASLFLSAHKNVNKVMTSLVENFDQYMSEEAQIVSMVGESISALQNAQKNMKKISTSKGGIEAYQASMGNSVIAEIKNSKNIRKTYKNYIKTPAKGLYYAKLWKDAKNVNNASVIIKDGKIATYLRNGKKWGNTGYKVLRFKHGKVTKLGKEIFKKMGCIEGDPNFLFNYAGKNVKGVTKALGKAASDGAKKSFKLVDFKGYKELSKVGKTLKAGGAVLSVATTGLMAYDNYNEARTSGLSKNKSIVSTVVGTVGDLAVSGASAQVGMAIGTALGGPAGLIAGAIAGYAIGQAGSFIMTGVKKGMNYVLKNGVGKTVSDAGKFVTKKAKEVTKAVSDKVSDITKGFQSVGKWAFG